MNMNKSGLNIAVVLYIHLIFGSVVTAASHTAISNLGDANATAAGVAWDIEFFDDGGIAYSANQIAGSFIAGNSAQLTGVSLSMAGVSGDPDYPEYNGGFGVSLLADDGGVPGAFLFNFSGNSDVETAAIYDYAVPSPFPLVAGQRYWITADHLEYTSVSSTYFWNATTSTATAGDPGWSIGRYASRIVSDSSGFPSSWYHSPDSSVQFSVSISSTLPGDFNNDGSVDAADYVVWRKGLGTMTYTQTDYDTWRAHFGETAGSGAALPSAQSLSAVPEPAAIALSLFVLLALACQRSVGSIARNWRGRKAH